MRNGILDPDELIGRSVDGVFEVLVDPNPKFTFQLILVDVRGVGLVPLELAAPKCLPQLRIHEGSAGERAAHFDIQSVMGRKISDVIASDCLASVSLVLEDGRIITNTVGEFGNFAAVMPATYLPKREEYVSLVKRP
jgi:hypothetical protein